MAEVHVRGLSELQRLLTELPVKLEKNIMRGALRAGANVIKKEAQRLVPVKDGDLRRSITVGSGRFQGGKVTVPVRATMWYSHFVEYGTQAHFIKVNQEVRPVRMTRRGARSWSIRTINRSVAKGSLVIGGHFIGASVAHPGAHAKPFLRPALDTAAAPALVAVGEYIKKRLTKQGISGAADVEVEAA